MTSNQFFEPRDRVLASRAAAALMAVAGVITGLFGLWRPQETVGVDRVDPVVLVTSGLLVVLAFVLFRTHGRGPVLVWTLAPVLGIALVTFQDLLTSDASASGQIFFCLPVLYAASQLRGPAAVTVLVLAVAGSATVSLALLPAQAAAADLLFMATTLTTVTALLVRAGDRQAKLTAQLQRMAAVDPLTGLVTRRVLDEAAQSAMSGARRNAGTALILIDIDHFKSVNDGHGHPVGDEALIHLADILTRHARFDDVICRMGGDEIAVLLPGCGIPAAVERAGTIVRHVRTSPMTLANGSELRLTVSVGIAHAPTDAVDLPGLYGAADGGLYEAKMAGRDQVGPVRRATATGTEVVAPTQTRPSSGDTDS